ncbi:MAG: hypothetical protein NTY33_00105 [Candidatus Moranbacteria bacterium]|nr:hypothetical protein [Candidatus Moranbacteria bacterium]
MNLEGKVYGYSKKTLALIVLVVLVGGVMFYAGAKYEKRKLTSMGLLKATATKKKAVDKNKPTDSTAPQDSATTPSDQNATTPASSATPATTPVTTPAIPQK